VSWVSNQQSLLFRYMIQLAAGIEMLESLFSNLGPKVSI
jgi:hypothetical protein